MSSAAPKALGPQDEQRVVLGACLRAWGQEGPSPALLCGCPRPQGSGSQKPHPPLSEPPRPSHCSRVRGKRELWLRPFPSRVVTTGGGDSPPEEDAVGNQVAVEMVRAVVGALAQEAPPVSEKESVRSARGWAARGSNPEPCPETQCVRADQPRAAGKVF